MGPSALTFRIKKEKKSLGILALEEYGCGYKSPAPPDMEPPPKRARRKEALFITVKGPPFGKENTFYIRIVAQKKQKSHVQNICGKEKKFWKFLPGVLKKL